MKVLELFYGGQMEHACQKQINWRAEGGRVLETNLCAEKRWASRPCKYWQASTEEGNDI